MKSIVASCICCIAMLHAGAADDLLIPAPLNTVLLKIQPGMSTNQVLAVLLPSYPKASGRMGEWSGQTGYFDYKLDERFTLSVSSVMRGGKEVVHDDLLFYFFDWQTKRRIDIKPYHWEGRRETTNSFGIYLTAEPVDRRITAYGKGDWSHLRLSESPLISATEIISYNFTDHSMKVKPEAVARIPRPPVEGIPFVVVVDGQRIYLGVFATCSSSMSFAVPSIMVDRQVFVTNQPLDTLVIDRAYPSPSFGVGPDPRGDERIINALAALEKLGEDYRLIQSQTAAHEIPARIDPGFKPEAGIEYTLVFPLLYRTSAAGPAERDNSIAWSRANEFVYRTALAKDYTLPAQESGTTSAAWCPVTFRSKQGKSQLMVEVDVRREVLRLPRQKSQGGTANGNQPSRKETNGPTGAAGSR